jgi:hypothetical protein
VIRNIIAFIRLPRDRRLLFAQAWSLSLVFPIVLRVGGLASTMRRLERLRPAETLPDDAEIRRFANVVDAAARRAWPPATCLTRSVVLARLLAKRGIQTSLRIGVDPRQGQYLAHAWVEYRGVPINDAMDVGARYLDFEIPQSFKSLKLQ